MKNIIGFTSCLVFLTIPNLVNANTVSNQSSQEPVKVTHQNEIAYAMHSCMRKSNTINCTLSLTSEGKVQKLTINVKNTRFIDLNGNEYFVSFAQIGKSVSNGYQVENNLINGVPFKASLEFDNIPQDINKLAILDIDIDYSDTNVRFDNIAIIQEPINTNNSDNYNYQNTPVVSEPASVNENPNSLQDTVNSVRQNVNTVRDILNIFR